MKNKTIYTVLLLLCVVGFWLFENFYTPDTYSEPEEEGSRREIPEQLLPSSTTGVVVDHRHFSLSYHEDYEQAEWVAYLLKQTDLTDDDRKRPYFIEDSKVRSKSADWRNYRGSGYDRGHLCPAGDRRFSAYAYDETFYTSNISPQDNAFNAGVWNRLEQQARYWTRKYGTLFVATGGVLEKDLPSIGDEDVAVPRYYYKIIAKGNKENPKVVAFLLPHQETTAPLERFLVPVDSIERLTGIDFFAKLPDAMENRIEAKAEMTDWKF
ncbi:DNA/RNA non-specific endonuclease [Spongiimicrobium sp. 2-473A-2-J]|uniref:DNA/RNA non-specific endonuclease n=1 Tax=Eudoraea algarum TaxID=3417568 RepID=UPI003D361871